MARTWSAPQRGSFAVLAAPVVRQQSLFAQLVAMGRHDPQRGLLLLVAALLAMTGLAVPHLDDESLSTLLFLAGAGLTALLIWVPGQPAGQAPSAVEAAGAAFSRRAALDRVASPTKFAELGGRPKSNPTIDTAAWAKLTAHMSHELRTPLNAVLGFSEMMSNEVFGPLGSSCYSSYARDIHASGRLLLKSAEDALAITALLTAPDRKGPPQISRLRAVSEDACAFALCDLAMHSIAIATDIGPDIDVIGDAQTTRQMLINLIAEASRNARNGAVLTIKADCTTESVRLAISLAPGDVAVVAQDDAFPMILARTLCELSGARLACSAATDGGRQWTVDFVPVAQNDLFYR
jgi:signal transduction histidine kinase